MSFVFCSREPGESKESDHFIKLVEAYRTPLVFLSYQRFKARQAATGSPSDTTLPPWRLYYDREVMRRLAKFDPGLCVLAGYMLIVGPEMCQRFNMINLHPAAPGGPTGTWQEVIWQLIDSRAKETGVMMHLVTPELDKGPPVAFCNFPITGPPFGRYWRRIEKLLPNSPQYTRARDSLFRLIRKQGLAREFPIIVSTLKAFGEGKIRITPDKRIVDTKGKVIHGYDLTDDINRMIQKPPPGKGAATSLGQRRVK
jgi:phosphoribosylglycinamide formyltransferase-1